MELREPFARDSDLLLGSAGRNMLPSSQVLGKADGRIYTGRFKDTSIRNLVDSYLGLGENIFSFCCGFAVSSSYWRRQIDD